LGEITAKKNWYTKIYDDTIVNKWKDEIKKHESLSDFNMAIDLLKATTQGSTCKPENEDYKSLDRHLDRKCIGNCYDKWEDPCSACMEDLKIRLTDKGFLKKHDIDDPEEFLDSIYGDPESLYEYMPECGHDTGCDCKSPDSDLYDYVMYMKYKTHDGKPTESVYRELLDVIHEMRKNEPVDYHPGSNEQVIDIIHPSVNCYAQGITKHVDGTIKEKISEDKMYSWLPAEFDVSDKGRVKLLSRINNLNSDKYPTFNGLIERLLQKRIKYLEEVIKKKVKGRRLQVIVKVASIELKPDSSKRCTKESLCNSIYKGGSWHIEGMPYENICASIIEYLEVDNITDSYLEFRKPTIINEENLDYPQSNEKFTEHHYGLTGHFDGKMNRYLGLIKCNQNSYVIFPNTLQHRVKEFQLKDPKKPSSRIILALFVIDPDNRIVSTQDVLPSNWNVEEMNHHRERLMFHRKYFVSQLNKEVFERPYSLCEH